MSTSKANPNVLAMAMICTAILAVATLAAVVTLVILAPRGADLAVLMAALFAGAGSMITSILNLARASQTAATVDDLANGKMDAKIRAAVSEVLDDRLIDPTIRDQLVADKERR